MAYRMVDRNFLIKLVQARMPYGRFETRYITELPVSYLEWMNRQGFPSGELGQFLATMHVIKTKDRKSTRLNSSHVAISYAVFCLLLCTSSSTLFPYTTLFRSGLIVWLTETF